MTSADDIKARISSGLARAGIRTGTGPLICTVKRPARTEGQTPWEAEAAGAGSPSYFEVTAVEDRRKVMDRSGTAISGMDRVLLVEATSGAILKSDRIAVGVRQASVDADTAFEEIMDVQPVAPSGVALMYEVTLAD